MASLFELLGNVNWSDLEGKKARESGIFEYSTSKVEIIMMVREMNKRLKVRTPSLSMLHYHAWSEVKAPALCDFEHAISCDSVVLHYNRVVFF